MTLRLRRALFLSVLIAGLLLIHSPAAAGQVRQWQFRVLLDEKPIGSHQYRLEENGTDRNVEITARFDVTVLFVPVYRYRHQATERWRGNCLTSLNAATNDNGDPSRVSAREDGARFVSQVNGKKSAAAGCVMSFAYWNPQILRQSRLLNAQTGELETVRVNKIEREKIKVRGTDVQATRYRISGPNSPIDLWYDADNNWLALQSTLQSGRSLRYELQ